MCWRLVYKKNLSVPLFCFIPEVASGMGNLVTQLMERSILLLQLGSIYTWSGLAGIQEQQQSSALNTVLSRAKPVHFDGYFSSVLASCACHSTGLPVIKRTRRFVLQTQKLWEQCAFQKFCFHSFPSLKLLRKKDKRRKVSEQFSGFGPCGFLHLFGRGLASGARRGESCWEDTGKKVSPSLHSTQWEVGVVSTTISSFFWGPSVPWKMGHGLGFVTGWAPRGPRKKRWYFNSPL